MSEQTKIGEKTYISNDMRYRLETWEINRKLGLSQGKNRRTVEPFDVAHSVST